MSDTPGHKTPMSEARRKVLDLLEFCAEMRPDLRICQVINNAVPLDLMRRPRGGAWDTYYIPDKDLAGWLQDYADKLLKEAKDV